MNDFHGFLSVFMFVTLPHNRGRDKKVTLATIPCTYTSRESALSEFKESNPDITQRIMADFTFREHVQ